MISLRSHILCVVSFDFEFSKCSIVDSIEYLYRLYTDILHIIDMNTKNTSTKFAKSGFFFFYLNLICWQVFQTNKQIIALLTQEREVKSGKHVILWPCSC